MRCSNVKCDNCNFTCGSDFWGRYVYQTNNELIDIPRQLGWCYSCGSIATVENISLDHIESAIDKNSRLVEHQRALVDRRASKFWPLRYFYNKAVTKKQMKLLRFYEVELRREILLREIIQQRESGERCLICGSSDTIAIKKSAYDDEKEVALLGLAHPNCGGNMSLVSAGFYMSVELTTKHYSTDGTFLFEDPREAVFN